MDAALRLGAMSYADYLALERASEAKHEYVNGEVYAMAGGTPEHARLQSRLDQLLGVALEGRPCAVFASDLRIRIVDTGRSTYPDVTVVCGRVETAADDEDAVTNPTLIVEVLSRNTEAEDRGPKWAHYQRIEALREYVLVGQDARGVEVFRRDGARWTYESFGPGDTARFESVGAAVAVDELYRNPLEDG